MHYNPKWGYYMPVAEYSETKMALGGPVTIGIVTNMVSREIESLFVRLWKRVFIFEQHFSRFLPMSEVSILNRRAGLRTPITPEFKDLLRAALQMSAATNGVYNPFILPALQRAGYIQSAAPSYEHDPQEDYSTRQIVPANQLKISEDSALIPYGTAIDMGGCGKGYLADELGAALRNEDIRGYWISMSGDIATYGTDQCGSPITIDTQSARAQNGECQIIECPTEHFGVATSGTFRRKNQQHTGKWHHIIDPRTGHPAVTDIRLATICAATALEADVLASCAIILGSEAAPDFLKERGVDDALLQCQTKTGRYFEVRFGPHINTNHKSLQKVGATHA